MASFLFTNQARAWDPPQRWTARMRYLTVIKSSHMQACFPLQQHSACRRYSITSIFVELWLYSTTKLQLHQGMFFSRIEGMSCLLPRYECWTSNKVGLHYFSDYYTKKLIINDLQQLFKHSEKSFWPISVIRHTWWTDNNFRIPPTAKLQLQWSKSRIRNTKPLEMLMPSKYHFSLGQTNLFKTKGLGYPYLFYKRACST